MKTNRALRRAAKRGAANYLTNVRSMIAERGFAVQGVSLDWTRPGWVYTIGLHRAGLPELILIGGLHPLDQHGLIDELARRMLAGDVIEPGRIDSGVIEGFDVTYLEVLDTSSDWFTVANRIQSGYRALQIVWPDHDDRFPWEDGYDIPLDDQPLLGLPPVA
jgi:uncharacterized protein DUF4262